MATTVRITETYDMKTTVGKMGLLGIHTPDKELIQKLYPGLCKNHKFIRFKKCDVVGACASVLPADPLQVGVEAGDVAPEDMFNPILYKAVTNDSFDTLVNRIYQQDGLPGMGNGSVENLPDIEGVTGCDAFDIYYSLLADGAGYKKSMPQAGWRVNGLVPICHTLISNYGNVGANTSIETQYADVKNIQNYTVPVDLMKRVQATNDDLDNTESAMYLGVTFRGKPVKMPKLPLHVGPEEYDAPSNFPLVRTYVMALVTPPARLHEFYYRMRVTWTISFEGVISTAVIASTSKWPIGGYGTNIQYSSSKSADEVEHTEAMVDANDVDIHKIMES